MTYRLWYNRQYIDFETEDAAFIAATTMRLPHYEIRDNQDMIVYTRYIGSK